MKKIHLLVPIAAALGLGIFTRTAHAAAGTGPKARIFAEFDKNKNGVIDGDEVAAVRKAFAADPKGPFAAYDKNKDAKLDDAEIAAIQPPGGGGKGGAKKGADAAKTPAPK
ncbi:MAG: EF-hand domain-containing protein [Opitutaceae bacterium]|nr:EF-hand domain-containing protein [Opitutaceae bacterium]